MECDVYKSLRPKYGREEFYLYVEADTGMDQVPEALAAQFGEVEKVLSFELTPEKKLAREDPEVVLRNLQTQGYHLQLPPADERFKG